MHQKYYKVAFRCLAYFLEQKILHLLHLLLFQAKEVHYTLVHTHYYMLTISGPMSPIRPVALLLTAGISY